MDTGSTRIALRQTVLPSRTMRFCLPLLLTLAALAGGCQGSGGAVSVRWRIVNLSTGESFDPGSVKVNSGTGSCCPTVNYVCTADSPWVVKTVAIVLRDPNTGVHVVDVDPFPCSAREKTTDFTLPSGTFAIGLDAIVTDGQGRAAPVAIPPPEVRTIIRGDVVNLQVIEIGVQPLPQPMAPGVPLPAPTQMVTF